METIKVYVSKVERGILEKIIRPLNLPIEEFVSYSLKKFLSGIEARGCSPYCNYKRCKSCIIKNSQQSIKQKMTKFNKSKHSTITNICAIVLIAFVSSALNAQNTTVVDYSTSTPFVIGEPVEETTSMEFTVTPIGNINVPSDSGGYETNSIRAYMSGAANFRLENEGSISAGWGVFAKTENGSIDIDNQNEIISRDDYSVYALAYGSGDVNVGNFGHISATFNETSGEEYDGAVIMQSLGNSSIDFNNSGTITGWNLNSPNVSNPAVVIADTGGSVNLQNLGAINALSTESSSSAPAGTGIYVSARVDGGTITNDGSISAQTAINIQGNNVVLKLNQGVTGDIVLGNTSNMLVVSNPLGVSVDGSVQMAGNDLKFVIDSSTSSSIPLLDITGDFNISGVDLTFDFVDLELQVGSKFVLVETSVVYGWFGSVEGDIVSDYDPDNIYSSGDYEFKLLLEDGRISIEIVPEPAAIAGVFGLIALGFAIAMRSSRKKIA